MFAKIKAWVLSAWDFVIGMFKRTPKTTAVPKETAEVKTPVDVETALKEINAEVPLNVNSFHEEEVTKGMALAVAPLKIMRAKDPAKLLIAAIKDGYDLIADNKALTINNATINNLIKLCVEKHPKHSVAIGKLLSPYIYVIKKLNKPDSTFTVVDVEVMFIPICP